MKYINTYEVFAAAWLGLKAQGFQRAVIDAGTAGTNCRYRAPDGRKCAIGHFIPDEEYTADMEMKSGPVILEMLGYEMHDSGDLGSFERRIFLRQLQTAHDEGRTPAEMEMMLRALAKFNHFSIEAIEA
jgi:hypothetical protein